MRKTGLCRLASFIRIGMTHSKCICRLRCSPASDGIDDVHLKFGLLRINDVMRMTGLRSRQSVYSLIKAGSLPHPVKIGRRVSAWRTSDVIEFIESLQQDPFVRNNISNKSWDK